MVLRRWQPCLSYTIKNVEWKDVPAVVLWLDLRVLSFLAALLIREGHCGPACVLWLWCPKGILQLASFSCPLLLQAKEGAVSGADTSWL